MLSTIVSYWLHYGNASVYNYGFSELSPSPLFYFDCNNFFKWDIQVHDWLINRLQINYRHIVSLILELMERRLNLWFFFDKFIHINLCYEKDISASSRNFQVNLLFCLPQLDQPKYNNWLWKLCPATVPYIITEHFHWNMALCCILGTKCVTCLYIDKFAPFHNQMSVFHNIFVKFL